jgi:pimeloyl-ACP methyl ester carboxylesterase
MSGETTHVMGAATSGSFEGVRTAAVDGISLAYREQGEGEAVVFVHGSASDLRTWEQQLPAIGTRYRAIAYSRRYARPNEDIEPGADDQMLPHVDDLAAFLRLIGAAPAHVVGHSWGAFICLLTAIRRPEIVRSLVLQEPPVLSLFVSTPPSPRELFPLLARRPRTALAILEFGARTIAPAQRAFRRGDDDQALQTFAHGVLGKETYERLPEERTQQARENLATLRAQLLGAGFPPLDENDVRGVRAPTLLMTGTRSPAVLIRLTEHLQRLLPRAERVDIAGASHAMQEENPDAVNEAILGFLARHASHGNVHSHRPHLPHSSERSLRHRGSHSKRSDPST